VPRNQLVLVWRYRIPAKTPVVGHSIVGEDLWDALPDYLYRFLFEGVGDGVLVRCWNGDSLPCFWMRPSVEKGIGIREFEEPVLVWGDDFAIRC